MPLDKQPEFPVIEGVLFAHVPEWPGYAVSDDGLVWTCLHGRVAGKKLFNAAWTQLSSRPNKQGYQTVSLWNGCKKRWFPRVHQLVLLSFVGPCPTGMEVCHFPDHTKTNNRLSNLCYGTKKENGQQGIEQGVYPRGGKKIGAVISDATALEIITRRRGGERPAAIAKALGIKFHHVDNVLGGRAWRHLNGGNKVVPDEGVEP